MKKLLIAVSALGMIAVSNAKVVKIVEPTKAQIKEMNMYAEEGSGDSMYFTTNKGIDAIHIESKGFDIVAKAKVGTCLELKGNEPLYENVKKVKCPKNLQGKK